MNNTTLIIFILSVVTMLMLVGCGKDDSQGDVSNALVKKAKQKENELAVKQAEDAAEDAEHEASQELVNFKCNIANMQTIYFYKGDMKIESVSPVETKESWLIDDKYYIKMTYADGEALVEYPGEESEMDAEGMMDTYAMSKTMDNIDCELGAASKSDVTLPDLEIIDEEEHGQRVMSAFQDQMYADSEKK